MSQSNILTAITLDYELFFGGSAGTTKRCLIDPTNALLRVARRRACRLVFFVDAGMLFRMRQQQDVCREVARQYEEVCSQLHQVVADGHDVQLHIHPHWEDSRWDGTHWVMDTRRYRLHDFADREIVAIVEKYRAALCDASGYRDICAYRAGGWAIQPFDKISLGLRAGGIEMDSTVMPGLHLTDMALGFDFRGAPNSGAWRFSVDPNIPDHDGDFLEVPISSTKAPLFIKFSSAISKRLGSSKHTIFGDGYAVNSGAPGRALSRIKRLLGNEPVPVTLDGYRAVLLAKAYAEHVANRSRTFVVISHPKGITPFAIDCLDDFLGKCKPKTVTFPQLREMLAVTR